MYFVYILKCCDNSFYIGSTGDLERRLSEHNTNHGGAHTKLLTPVELVHNEEFETEPKAMLREKQLKGWSRKKKKALIDGNKDLLLKLSKSNP